VRRFLSLITTAAIALAVVVPAFAQRDTGQEPAPRTATVTGVIDKPEVTPYMYGTHAITDEASGTRYALRSEDEGLLDGYTDRRVTLNGTLVSEYENGAIEGGPPLLDVAHVDPTDSFGTVDPELGVDLNEDGTVDEVDASGEGGVIPGVGPPHLLVRKMACFQSPSSRSPASPYFITISGLRI